MTISNESNEELNLLRKFASVPVTEGFGGPIIGKCDNIRQNPDGSFFGDITFNDSEKIIEAIQITSTPKQIKEQN